MCTTMRVLQGLAYSKTLSLHLWLFGIEFGDTTLVLLKDCVYASLLKDPHQG